MFRKSNKKTHFLTDQSLENLKDHKYSCTGRSFIEPAFQKFWNWIIEYVPSNIAPNTLTLVGLIANVTSIIILSIQFSIDPNNIPTWSLILCSFSLFFYQTLDALDGKQARKTNTSSQLGEMFDHGCDAISSNFVVLGNIIAIGMFDYPWLAFIHFFMTVCDFYIAHWQVYVSGTLEFGFVDVTESQLAVILVYLVSAIFGIEFWNTNMPYFNIQWKIFHFFVMLIGGINICWRYFKSILKGGCGRHGATVANTSILFPFCPIALIVSMAITVAVKSPTNIYQQYPVLFLMSFGMVACKITQKIVVAHLTKSELVLIDTELVGPILLVLNQYWFNTYFDEYLILWICLILSTINTLYYVSCICIQVADYLNLYIFSVTKRPSTHTTTAASVITEYRKLSPTAKGDSDENSNDHKKHISKPISSSASSSPSVKKSFKTVEADKLKWKKKN